MAMDATLQGDGCPTARTREVNDKSFTTFIVEQNGNELKAFVMSEDYVAFGEELLRAGMEYLRLARERAEEKCQSEHPARSS